MSRQAADHTLDVLLDLDGQTFFVGSAQTYWVKFKARRTEPTEEKPHGIDYSLTLHDPSGKRLIGYDNVHATQATQGPGGKKTRSQDHRHRCDTIRPYAFKDAATLLADFWKDVDNMLKEKGVKE
jgi:hypothetical protein